MPSTRSKTAEAAAVEAEEIADGEAVERQLQSPNPDQLDKSAKSDSEADAFEIQRTLMDLSDEDQDFLVKTEKELVERFGDVEETTSALASLKTVVTHMMHIREYRGKYGSTEQISCISFSKLGGDDLPSIGVEGLVAPVCVESACIKLRDIPSFERNGERNSAVDVFDTEWTTRGKDLFVALKFHAESINDKSEMTSRTMVDPLLLLLRYVGFASQTHITIHPEMELGSTKALGVPIYTKPRNAHPRPERQTRPVRAVFLTGYLDWGVFGRNDRLNPENEMARKDLQAKIVACSDLLGLVKLSRRFHTLSFWQMLCQFLVVEAKNVKLCLEAHLPQVIGQSVATCKAREVKHTAWILTNGWSWIFGVTRRKNFSPNESVDSREPHEFDYRRTTAMTIDFQAEDAMQQLENIAYCLVCFATVDAQALMVNLESCPEIEVPEFQDGEPTEPQNEH